MLRWLARILVGLFAALLAAGLMALFRRAFSAPDGGVGFERFSQLIAEPGLSRATALSLSTGLAATLLSVIATAILFAGLSGLRATTLMERIARPILAMPHAAFAFGWLLLLTPGGWAVRLVHSVTGLFDEPPAIVTVNDSLGVTLTLALAAKETPFLLLVGLPAFARIMREQHLEMARSLGHHPAFAFISALWPRLYRELRLPVLAILVYGVSVVDMAQILGPTTPPTLAVLATRLMSSGGATGLAIGEAAGVLMVGIAMLAVLIWIVLERLGGTALRHLAEGGHRGRRLGLPFGIARKGLLLFLFLSGALPLAALLLSAFAASWPYPDAWPGGLTLIGWKQPGLFGAAFGNTLLIAAIAAIAGIAIVIAVLEGGMEEGTKLRGIASAILFAPLLLPQISLVAGLSSVLDEASIGYGMGAVIIAHLLYTVPYAYLSFSASHATLDQRYGEIAASLGKRPLAILFRVRLPILFPSLCVAIGIGLSVSFALYLPTLIAGGGRISTITTEAVALASGGERRPVAVLGLLQAMLPAAGFVLAAFAPRLVGRLVGWVAR
jgi:putative thiamine transport system permease protein